MDCSSHCALVTARLRFMICLMETSSDADAAWFSTFQTSHLVLLFSCIAEMYSFKLGYSLFLIIF